MLGPFPQLQSGRVGVVGIVVFLCFVAVPGLVAASPPPSPLLEVAPPPSLGTCFRQPRNTVWHQPSERNETSSGGACYGIGASEAQPRWAVDAVCAGYGFSCVNVVAMRDRQVCDDTWATLDLAGRQQKAIASTNVQEVVSTAFVCGTCQAAPFPPASGGDRGFFRVACATGGTAATQTLSVSITPGCHDDACSRCDGTTESTTLREAGAASPARCAPLFPGSAWFATPIGFSTSCTAVRLRTRPVASVSELNATCDAPTSSSATIYAPPGICTLVPGSGSDAPPVWAATACGTPANPPTPGPDDAGAAPERNGASTLVVVLGLMVAFACICIGLYTIFRARTRELRARRNRDAFLDAHSMDEERKEELTSVAHGGAARTSVPISPGDAVRLGAHDGDADVGGAAAAGAAVERDTMLPTEPSRSERDADDV